MKFIINKEIGHVNKDRVCILKINEPYTNTYSDGSTSNHTRTISYLCNTVVNVTKDWEYSADFSIVDEFSSIQYRPKAIFKNNKGYFYKNNKVIYLTDLEVSEMKDFIINARDFINNTNANTNI